MNGRALLLAMGWLCAAGTCHAEDHVTLRQKAGEGVEGWTMATEKSSRDAWMNHTLVVRIGGVEKRMAVSYAFIEAWGFADAGTTVVVAMRNAHGPAWIQKFRIATGEVVAETAGSDFLEDTPEWARPWCDAARERK